MGTNRNKVEPAHTCADRRSGCGSRSTASGRASRRRTAWGKRADRVHTNRDDATRLRLHVLPRMGDLVLAEVRPRHVRELVESLRQTKLAPRSQLHVHGVVRAMMQSAVRDELIPSNPCVLGRESLPLKADKDPALRWRVYDRRQEPSAGSAFTPRTASRPSARRASHVTLALADGARKDVLRWVTHGPEGDIVDLYTTLPWATLCEEAASCASSAALAW